MVPPPLDPAIYSGLLFEVSHHSSSGSWPLQLLPSIWRPGLWDPAMILAWPWDPAMILALAWGAPRFYSGHTTASSQLPYRVGWDIPRFTV